MQTKLVDVKVKNDKVQLFVKGKEAQPKEFTYTDAKEVAKVKALYSLTDSEYMTACFEIRRSLHE